MTEPYLSALLMADRQRALRCQANDWRLLRRPRPARNHGWQHDRGVAHRPVPHPA